MHRQPRFVGQRADPFGVEQEFLAGLGQDDGPSDPFEEGRLKGPLELANLRRDGGLGQKQLRGGARVAAVSGDCQKDAKLMKGHSSIIKKLL